MSDFYKKILDNNKEWVEKTLSKDPNYFKHLAKEQKPPLLWIGCSDSRVPANEIIGAKPGDVFVHRNIANMVVHSDMNMLSVLDYAVNVLKVKHVIVCGHYGCGGVHAACGGRQFGLIDNWLRNIKDVYSRYRQELNSIADDYQRGERLCELNVIEQVRNVCHTTIVQNAWASGRPLAVHGLIYGLGDGLLRDLAVRITNPDQIDDIYRTRAQHSAT